MLSELSKVNPKLILIIIPVVLIIGYFVISGLDNVEPPVNSGGDEFGGISNPEAAVVEPVPEPVVEPVPEPVVEPVPEIKEIEVHEGEVIITIENLKYIPNEITVRLGTIITWINKDNSDPLYAEHTVMIDELNAKSPEIVFAGGAKEKWSYTFNEIGEFSYYCSIHPFMKGKIIVVE